MVQHYSILPKKWRGLTGAGVADELKTACIHTSSSVSKTAHLFTIRNNNSQYVPEFGNIADVRSPPFPENRSLNPVWFKLFSGAHPESRDKSLDILPRHAKPPTTEMPNSVTTLQPYLLLTLDSQLFPS
jgi:hypothetical protein